MSDQTQSSVAAPAATTTPLPANEALPGETEGAAAVAAAVAEPVLAPIPTPEEISRMTDEAYRSFEVAVGNLRRIGSVAVEMGGTIDARCEAAATDMLKRARSTLLSFEGFATIMRTLGGSVGEITAGLEEAVGKRRPPQADEYGIGPNNGRGREQGR